MRACVRVRVRVFVCVLAAGLFSSNPISFPFQVRAPHGFFVAGMFAPSRPSRQSPPSPSGSLPLASCTCDLLKINNNVSIKNKTLNVISKKKNVL